MSEPKPMLRFLYPNHIYRPENDWCETCLKSSMLESDVILISMEGVTPWGIVKFCRECTVKIWISLKGNVIPVKCHYPNKET